MWKTIDGFVVSLFDYIGRKRSNKVMLEAVDTYISQTYRNNYREKGANGVTFKQVCDHFEKTYTYTPSELTKTLKELEGRQVIHSYTRNGIRIYAPLLWVE